VAGVSPAIHGSCSRYGCLHRLSIPQRYREREFASAGADNAQVVTPA
jgi:hypothetical protein